MPFTPEQIKQLLQPINPRRVLQDGKKNSHVAQQDVTAHLTRIFGFGGWTKEVLDVQLIFEAERTDKPGRWDVAYKALVRLTVKDPDGQVVAFYEDGSTGSAQNQSHADAHDLAYKSAISLSTKRAAKDLGDQFGLSLYNKGQMTALVGGTLVNGPEDPGGTPEDIQQNVEQQVAMGNDEIDTPVEAEPEPEPPKKAPAKKAAPKKVDPKVADAAEQLSPNAQAIVELVALCDSQQWTREAINDLYTATYKVGVKDGAAEDLNAFRALLETGAIKP